VTCSSNSFASSAFASARVRHDRLTYRRSERGPIDSCAITLPSDLRRKMLPMPGSLLLGTLEV
jgi:hypothetical protein